MQFRVLKDNRTFIPIYYIQNQGLRCEDEKHNVGFFLA